jgi:trans-2,3-dihydro-3-hydroxyanthranilate isomerase
MPYEYHILDVFTDEPLQGNPLAVVRDAEGLSPERMQAIAREFNLPETVFVLPAQNPAHSARVRIFSPAMELPFAGHPTIGTAVLLAGLRLDDLGGQNNALIVLEQAIGVVRVGVTLRPDAAPFAEFDAPKLPVDAGAPAPEDRLAAALGLATAEIGFENHHPSRYDAGMPFTFVPVEGIDAIRRARIVHNHWHEAFRGDTMQAAFVYCRETVRNRSSFHARMFAPMAGIAEDPATGSAVVALAGVINRFDRPGDGTHTCLIEQGFEMGRPSEIELEMEIGGHQVTGVRIGGSAVRVARGVMEIS